jgi:hypothetical protein
MAVHDAIHRKIKSDDENKKDFYQTSPPLIMALIEGMRDLKLYTHNIGRMARVLDPCAGNGAIGNVLKKHFEQVTEFDLYSGYTYEKDFLKEDGWYDYIIFNSPYTKKNAFIEHALEISNFVFSLLPIGVENYTIMNEKFFDDDAYIGKIKCYPKFFMTEDLPDKIKWGGMSCYAWHIFTSDSDKQKKFKTTKFEIIKDIRKYTDI